MGDIVLTTSLIRQIKKKYPTSRLDMVVAKQFVEIIKFNPYVDNIIEYDKSAQTSDIVKQKNELKSKLPSGHYEYVIDLQKNLRSKVFRSGLGKRYYFMNKRRLHKLALVYLKRSLMKDVIPIPDIYTSTVSELGIQIDDLGLELWLEKDKNHNTYLPYKKKIIDKEKLKIAIAPSAFHYTKQYPKEKFLELIEKINSEMDTEICIIGGTKDKEITDYILENSSVKLQDYSCSTSILKTAEVIDECDLLITNDTGVMHIAAARKVPIVAIFGSTVKEFGFIPYKTPYEIVEVNEECRPCTHIGKNKCPKIHLNCLNKIQVDDIFNSMKRLLNI